MMAIIKLFVEGKGMLTFLAFFFMEPVLPKNSKLLISLGKA